MNVATVWACPSGAMTTVRLESLTYGLPPCDGADLSILQAKMAVTVSTAGALSDRLPRSEPVKQGMAWNPFCALAVSGAGLALSLSAARCVPVFKTWLPAWVGFLAIGLAIGLAAGAALMQWLGYRW